MKPFLIIIQILYVLSLLPWYVTWLMSFMSFDSGVNVWNVCLMLLISLYPLIVIVSSLLAWVFRVKKPHAARIINCIPIFWIGFFLVFILITSLVEHMMPSF